MNQNYAGIFQRFVAALIDGILLGIVSWGLGYVVGMAASSNDQVSSAAVGSVQLLSWAISIGYYVVYQAKVGQTIGKKAMGIKVITVDNKAPTMFTFFLREIIGKFISAIIFFIGYIMVFWDPRKQALHDKIAGTLVVKAEASSAPAPATPNAPAASAAPTVEEKK